MTATRSRSTPSAPRQLATVLVVDDEPALCRLWRNTLGREGYAVHIAGSFQAGLAAGLTEAIDVVLIDIVLPDGDGLRLAATLRQARPGVRVIIVSGYLDEVAAVDAMKLGAADALRKPVRADRLVNAVREALADGSARRQAEADLHRPMPVAERCARLLLRVALAAEDPRTIELAARAAGLSATVFCETCRLAAVKPRAAKDLARVLRALWRARGEAADLATHLDARDARTLSHLLDLAGPPRAGHITVATLLRQQRFLPAGHEVAQALERLLADVTPGN